jgi:hypothetical protein
MSKTINETTRDPNRLKVFNSPIYRKKIKRMVQMVKNVYGIHTKIPKGSLPQLPANATEQQRVDRAKKENYRLNIQVLHDLATPLGGGGYAISKQDNSSQGDDTDTGS